MKTAAVLFAFLFGIFNSHATEATKDKTQTLLHNGLKRSYIVHLPENYSPTQKYPLVFALHGGGGTAKSFNRSTRGRFNKLADQENFILVYPQGIEKLWNDHPNRITAGNAAPKTTDDVGFIETLITKLEAGYSIDSNNIFSCGISNGGLMSLTLAVELPNKIKAIGMVSSNFSVIKAAEMKNAQPFSALIIHGTEDSIFPYEPGEIRVFKQRRGHVLGAIGSIKLMCDINGNNLSGTTQDLPNPVLKDRCTATRTVFPNVENPALKLELITVKGGGHTWPGGFQYLPKKIVGRVSKDFNACDALWTFFKSTME